MRQRVLCGLTAVTALLFGCVPDERGASGPTPSSSATQNESGNVAGNRMKEVLEHSCTGEGVGPFPAEGQFPPARNWRRTELVAGGAGFEDHAQSRHRRPERFAGKYDEYRAYAFAVIVPAGGNATVRIIRSQAAFLRDPSDDGGDGRFKLSQGARVLRLTACDEEDTRFLEGLIVGGAQCVRLRAGTGPQRESLVKMPLATSCH